MLKMIRALGTEPSILDYDEGWCRGALWGIHAASVEPQKKLQELIDALEEAGERLRLETWREGRETLLTLPVR